MCSACAVDGYCYCGTASQPLPLGEKCGCLSGSYCQHCGHTSQGQRPKPAVTGDDDGQDDYAIADADGGAADASDGAADASDGAADASDGAADASDGAADAGSGSEGGEGGDPWPSDEPETREV